ncbi:MAG: hypothetical protein P8Y94_13080 [Acidobacteriota bacterium]
MKTKCLAVFSLLILLTAPALGQEVAARILATYGGLGVLHHASRFEITGHIGGESLGEVFTLKVSGESSRFETPHFQAIRNGRFAQGGPADRALPKARRSAIGLDQPMILPLALIARLAEPSFKSAGLADGVYVFEGAVERTGFIGYSPPPIRVELAFDEKTLLLKSATFTCVDDATLNLSMTYDDYAEVEGIPVASTVTRWNGDKPMYVLRIDTVDLNPKFSDDDVQLVGKGGRQ